MEGSLLRKESEFYKMNEQLELKAQKLMEEVESVMKNPDLLKVDTDVPDTRAPVGKEVITKTRADLLLKQQTQYSKMADNSVATGVQTAELVAKLDSLPEAAKGVGPEAALHILRVKSQLLEQELEIIRIEFKNKTEMWKKSRIRFDQLQEDHQKWHQQADNIQQLYRKQQERLQQLNSSLQSKEVENNSMLKEVERLRKELKQTCQSAASNKSKLNRNLDENGKLKSALSKLETEEKELRERDRSETEHSVAKINLLEKRKKEVVRGINTQLDLVGNLKTQLVHLDVTLNVEMVEKKLPRTEELASAIKQ